MPVKWYISPVIGDGSDENPRRAKVMDYGVACSAIIPSGTSWALVYASAPDLSALDADPEIKDVFEKFASGRNFDEIRAFLKSKTVSDLAPAKRNAVQAYLTGLGVDLTGVTLSTMLWDVLERVKEKLVPGGRLVSIRISE